MLAEFSCGSTDESNRSIPFFYFWLCGKRKRRRFEEGGRKRGRRKEKRRVGEREGEGKMKEEGKRRL